MSSELVVAVQPDGSLVLSCGHVVRRVKRRDRVICEHCQPERFAKLSANGKKQWPGFRARGDARGGRSASAQGEAPLAREDSP